jgi:iron complex outermembrane recepter protein
MSDQRRPVSALIAAAVAVSLLGSRLAAADDLGIQEVVVTAQKRYENLQEVPVAITALTSQELTNRGVTSYTGIAQTTPSINFTPYPSSSNTLILYMRGLGVADANQITQDGSVGLYEDGFYISRPQAATFDLADVERVEVLRGPQGTLYGRNTTGGAVNIISQKPTGELGFKGSLTAGNQGHTRALGTLNLPSMGPLSAKLTLLYTNRDGYTQNPGSTDFGLERQRGGRVSLRFANDGPFSADYFFEHGTIDSTPIYYEDPALEGKIPGYYGSGQPNPVAWRHFNLPLSTSTSDAHGLTLAWEINASTTLKSLTGYRSLRADSFQNYGDAFSDPATAAFTGYTEFTSADYIRSHQFSEELQLVGDVGKQFNYVVGLFYFKEGGNHREDGGILIPGLPLACVFSPTCAVPIPLSISFNEQERRFVTADAESQAAYFQGTWKPAAFGEKLAVTLGARYTKDTREATRSWNGTFVPVGIPAFGEAAGANKQSFTKFNPSGSVSYEWTPELNTYARLSTGYKAGGSSESGNPGLFGLTYGPEKLTQFELGLKSYWLNRRLRLNAAVFFSDVKDYQISFNTDPTNLAFVLTQNAGKAEITGLELEALVQPTKDFTVGLNWAYLDAKIKNVTALAGTLFDPAVNPASPYKVGQDISQLFRAPYAPQNIITVNTDWTFAHTTSGAFSVQLNYRYQDRQYDTVETGAAVPNTTKFYSIGGYGLLDARLNWIRDLDNEKRLRISAWMNNVVNKRYAQHVIGQGPIVATGVPPNVTPAGLTYQSIAWAPKPLVGLDIAYGF